MKLYLPKPFVFCFVDQSNRIDSHITAILKIVRCAVILVRQLLETQTGRKSTSQLMETLTVFLTQTAPTELHEKVWIKSNHLLELLLVGND